MTLTIFVRGVEGGAKLKELADKKFASGLRRFEAVIRKATVKLEDETGPRKQTVDKVCTVELKLARGGELRVREVGDDFAGVINTALDRVKAALSRSVGRMKRGVGEG